MRGRFHTLMIAAWCAGYACTAFAEQDGFSVNARIYRIEGVPVYVYGEDADVRSGNAKLKARLDTPITVAFEKVHIQEILGFVQKIYGVEFRIDENLIAPPNHAAAGYVTDGMVAYINLKDVALRQGLTALLHPMGLGLVAEDGQIRIRRAADVARAESTQQAPASFAPGDQWRILTQGEIRVSHAIVSLSTESTLRLDNVEGVESVGNPVVFLTDGQKGTISIDGPVMYLAEIPGTEGKYERHYTQAGGLSLGMACNPLAGDAAECDLDLNYSYVKERRILPGTSFAAGEPLIARTVTQQKVSMVLGRPVAMLTRLGERSDDTLLVLLRVSRMPAPAVPAASPSLRQYSLKTTFLQAHGEPNWEWWMRPYDRAYRIYEGAGRLIGPVSAVEFEDEKKIDWAKLGMRQVKQANVLSNPRATGVIDHRRLIGEGIVDFRGTRITEPTAVAQPGEDGGRGGGRKADGTWSSPFEHIDQLYLGLTGTPRTFTREDLEGKLIIADIAEAYRQEDGQVKPVSKGVAIFGEAESTPLKEEFSVQQMLLARSLRLGVQKQKQEPPESDFFRTQMRCEMNMRDGETSAFLMPIGGDEFLIVLSKFELVKE